MAADYRFLREAFLITRYHTVGHVHMKETVGHHTANVIGLIFFLYEDVPPTNLVRYALHHDAAELVTGDLPAPVKWQYPELKKAVDRVEAEVESKTGLTPSTILRPEEWAIFKYADMMDLCMKSVEELSTGNQPFAPLLGRGLHYCNELLRGELRGHKRAHLLMAVLQANEYVSILEINLESERDNQPVH